MAASDFTMWCSITNNIFNFRTNASRCDIVLKHTIEYNTTFTMCCENQLLLITSAHSL